MISAIMTKIINMMIIINILSDVLPTGYILYCPFETLTVVTNMVLCLRWWVMPKPHSQYDQYDHDYKHQ